MGQKANSAQQKKASIICSIEYITFVHDHPLPPQSEQVRFPHQQNNQIISHNLGMGVLVADLVDAQVVQRMTVARGTAGMMVAAGLDTAA